MFPISVDFLIPLGTPYSQVPVRGDICKGTVWETRERSDLKTKVVERSVNSDRRVYSTLNTLEGIDPRVFGDHFHSVRYG